MTTPPDTTPPDGPADATPPDAAPNETKQVGAEVAVRRGSLDIRSDQPYWSDRQLAALVQMAGFASVPPQPVLQAYFHLCQSTGLDPFRREIYLIARNVKVAQNRYDTRYTPQTGIDGYRHLAAETGTYKGRVGPQWCGPDGVWQDVWLNRENPPVAARVGVRVAGQADPVWAVAHYDEYVSMEPVYEGSGQSRRRVGEQPTMMWRKMPSNQLAKCAEAQAIRAAFPRATAGVYVAEEMEAADARASQDAAELAEAEKAQARARAAAGEDIVDGETVDTPAVEEATTKTVEELRAELDAVAVARGTTATALARYAMIRLRKNLDQFTAGELASAIRDLPQVSETLDQTSGSADGVIGPNFGEKGDGG